MRIALAVIHRQVGFPAMWKALAGLQRPAGASTIQVAVEGTSVANQRNQCVRAALEHGCEWLLFIDDDHVFAPDSLIRLLAHNLDLVGGTYITKIEPHGTTAMKTDPDHPGKFRSLTPAEQAADGPIPVDGLGMGFTLIRTAVFGLLEAPWFRMGQFGADEMAEDTYFCMAAKAVGVQPFCDVTLVIPHLAVKAVVPDGEAVRVFDPMKAMQFVSARRATVPQE